jgi:hypothetical protein
MVYSLRIRLLTNPDKRQKGEPDSHMNEAETVTQTVTPSVTHWGNTVVYALAKH